MRFIIPQRIILHSSTPTESDLSYDKESLKSCLITYISASRVLSRPLGDLPQFNARNKVGIIEETTKLVAGNSI